MLRLALAAFLISTPALGGKNDASWNPPSRFDYAYTGKLTVRYLPQKQVVSACANLFAKYKIKAKPTFTQHGCAAITSKTSCTVIVINKVFALATPKAVLRHELGHCAGWPADHPN